MLISLSLRCAITTISPLRQALTKAHFFVCLTLVSVQASQLSLSGSFKYVLREESLLDLAFSQ